MYPYQLETIPVGSYWLSLSPDREVFKCVAMWPMIGGVGRVKYSMFCIRNDETVIFDEDDMFDYEFQEINEEDVPLHLLGGCGE